MPLPAPCLAFDVYGTLLDTHGVVDALTQLIGARARQFSQAWRDKQLEYTFRRGLMGVYRDFDQCTQQALNYVDATFATDLSADDKRRLVAAYLSLPAFTDVAPALATLQRRNCRLYALSNGRADSLASLLTQAGIADAFTAIVSVDEVATFKPDPRVYRHFAERAGAALESCWLVSANPFDVIGAVATGMRGAWLRRSDTAVFDPWEFQPHAELRTLGDIERVLEQRHLQ